MQSASGEKLARKRSRPIATPVRDHRDPVARACNDAAMESETLVAYIADA